jgi:hypothetical protein
LIAGFVTEGDTALTKLPEWFEEPAQALWLNSTGLALGDDFYNGL